MVFDTLQNYRKYLSLHKNFSVAFEFLEQYKMNPLSVGKFEILGEEVFALVQEYQPKSTARLESHKEYIDIQFVASGNEKMECIDTNKCQISEDCTPEKDMIFYFDNSKVNTFVVDKNEFTIFFPNDAHKPGLLNEAESVRKIVVKVRV